MSADSRSAVARSAATVLDVVLEMREEIKNARSDEGAFGSSGQIDELGAKVLDDLALEAIPRRDLELVIDAAENATDNRAQAAEIAGVLVYVAKRLAIFLA